MGTLNDTFTGKERDFHERLACLVEDIRAHQLGKNTLLARLHALEAEAYLLDPNPRYHHRHRRHLRIALDALKDY